MPAIHAKPLGIAPFKVALLIALLEYSIEAKSQESGLEVTDRLKISITQRTYPDTERVAEYRISTDGVITRLDSAAPIVDLNDEIKILQEDEDVQSVIFGDPKVSSAHFLKIYSAFQHPLGDRLRLGGLAGLADFSTTSAPRASREALMKLGKIIGFRHFVYVKSDDEHRCDIYFNVTPTDRIALVRIAQNVMYTLDAQAQVNPYTLTVFVDPQTDFGCLGSAIYNLNYSGFTSLQIEQVKQKGD